MSSIRPIWGSWLPGSPPVRLWSVCLCDTCETQQSYAGSCQETGCYGRVQAWRAVLLRDLIGSLDADAKSLLSRLQLRTGSSGERNDGPENGPQNQSDPNRPKSS